MSYDCYKTPPEDTFFDFDSAWHDYRCEDGYSILGNRDFKEYLTQEVAELFPHDARTYDYWEPYKIADILTLNHGEVYKVGTLHGCVQGDWQYIVYPERFASDIPFIEQEYFNICDEWHCVPDNGNTDDGFCCWTYPLANESDEEQLRNICCDEVELHYPRLAYVWG